MFENKIVNEETDISKAAVRGNHSWNMFLTQNLKALETEFTESYYVFLLKIQMCLLLQVTLNWWIQIHTFSWTPGWFFFLCKKQEHFTISGKISLIYEYLDSKIP